ncbi:MAG: T9SS type A sorting domain-containing protein [Schleiferiaceae bacterium]|nr:T9SS type A sorting domain-containing protein [Schleiferiaceae bacterium]
MKKILLGIGAICFAFTAYSQDNASDNEVDDISWGQAKQRTAFPKAIGNGIEATPLWTEDFGNGFPAGWIVDDASGINPWKHTFVGSAGFFNGNQGVSGTNAIQSTTAANGFLINDPDSANHHTHGQPSSNYVYCNSYIYTNKIDLGATYANLVLDFQQSFRFNNNVDMIVKVSTDSINWTNFNVKGNASNNTASANPEFISLPISAATGPTQNVYLAFGWDVRVYFWMIDDLSISEAPPHGMALTTYQGAPPTDIIYRPNHAGLNGNAKYGNMAFKQNREIVFDANAFNLGQNPQTNVRLEVDIFDGMNNLVTTLISPSTPILAPFDTLTFADLTTNTWTPATRGTFTAVYNILSDTINGTNNYGVPRDSLTFFVTDTLLGPDFGQINNLIGTNATFGEDACAFMPRMDLLADEYVYGVWVWLSSTTVPGGAVEVFIRDTAGLSLTNGFPVTANPIAIGTHVVTQDDVDNNFMYIDLTDANGEPVFLTTGSYYTEVVLFSNGLTNPIILGNDQTVDQPGLSTLYYTTRAGIAPRYFARFTGSRNFASPLIRLVTCSVDEVVCGPKGVSVDNLTKETFVSVFPNPASDNIYLESSAIGKATLVLLNTNGQQIMQRTIQFDGSRQQINIEQLAQGVYLMQLTHEDGLFTTYKVVVQ